MTRSLLLETRVAPRFRSVPAYSYSSGDDAIALAASAGLYLDEWQQDAVRDILAEDELGKWSTFEAALVVPRQNGKNAVLEAIELAALFLFEERLIIHTAHLFPTSVEAFLRIRQLIESNPDFDAQVHRVRTGKGDEAIELKSGQRLRFLTRSGSSGRGFSADRLIYDEAYELPEETVAASLPTMSARPNPQLIYTSSAPANSAKSMSLRRVMKRGRLEPDKGSDVPLEADPNLCYIEYSADPKADLDDREEWRNSNPGTDSGRITVDFIAKERAALSAVAFARERMGILDESAGSTVIDMDVWGSRGDTLSSVLDPVCFAVDVNPDASFASIAVAGARADGAVHVEVVERRRGTGWVVDRIEDLVSKWDVKSVTLDAIGPAGLLLPAFSERGIHIDVVSMREYGHACALFKQNVDEGVLWHKEQSGLTAALEAARKRDLDRDAGLWAWHRRDSTDITPLVASTLAVFAHARTSGKKPEPESSGVVFFR